MKHLASLILIFASGQATAAEPQPAPTPAAPIEKPFKKAESVDISDMENDYWRPNKDELEVIQNRRFEKAKRFEFSVLYGIYQGANYVNSKAQGAAVTYNITNEWFVDAEYLSISSQENDLAKSFRSQFGTTPDYNTESRQESVSVGWTPIYAKFALLGKKISHFEMYVAPGIGVTKTVDQHLTEHVTIGQKFFITEHFLFRLDWKMSFYKDTVYTTQGATAKKNGGPGSLQQNETKHNIIFGLGWMF